MNMIEIVETLTTTGPMTSKQIGERLYMSKSAVSRYLKKLKDKKMIYISDYQRCVQGGHHSPIYAIGDAPYAEPPPRSTKPRKPQVRIPRTVDILKLRNQKAGIWAGIVGMIHKLNSDKTAVVAPNVKWLTIDEYTPIGAKMQIIDKAQNIAYTRVHCKGDGFTHWFPVPTFDKDEE